MKLVVRNRALLRARDFLAEHFDEYYRTACFDGSLLTILAAYTVGLLAGGFAWLPCVLTEEYSKLIFGVLLQTIFTWIALQISS